MRYGSRESPFTRLGYPAQGAGRSFEKWYNVLDALYIGSRLLNGLLSPESWNSSNANVWNVHGSDNPGNLNNDNVNNVNGVRPEFL